MSIRTELINAIFTAIGENVPEVAYIDLWNEQIAYIAEGAVWPTPALFVEFEEIAWQQEMQRVRRADVGIRLHIITRHVSGTGVYLHTTGDDSEVKNITPATGAVEYFNLIDRINAVMSSLVGENFTPLMLTTSTTNHNHEELVESVERYVCRARDLSSATTGNVVPVPVTTLKLR